MTFWTLGNEDDNVMCSDDNQGIMHSHAVIRRVNVDVSTY